MSDPVLSLLIFLLVLICMIVSGLIGFLAGRYITPPLPIPGPRGPRGKRGRAGECQCPESRGRHSQPESTYTFTGRGKS